MLQTTIPLSQRVYRGKYSQSTGVGTLQQTCDHATRNCVVGYKEWTYDKMDKAIKAVIDDGMSIRRAAEEFNVPKSTLGDRISGRTLHGASSGRPKYLTDEEEDILVKFLLKCAAIGYPRSRNEVIAMVQRSCDGRDMDVHVTHGWWERFCYRHPEISLRTMSALSYARAKGQNKEALSSYFDVLEDTYNEHKLHDKPALVFNMDETGLPLSPDPIKGVCKKGTNTSNTITSGDKSQITVVGCVSAAGHCIPPMIIWDRKTLHADMTKGELPGTIYGLSSRGWIDQELFKIWFEFHFLRYAPPVRPILLLMDGHSSHYCPDTVLLAAKEKVILFTLPPNTTHLTQPLDKGCFGPLKSAWRKACHDFLAQNPGKVVSRYSFCSVFAIAWLQAMSIKNILAGFKVTGTFPIDRHKLIPCDSSAPSLLQSVDPAYIPMLGSTPSKKISTPNPIVFSDSEHESYYKKQQHKDDFCDEVDNNGEEKKNRYMLWKDMYSPYKFTCDESPKKSKLPISSLCSTVCTSKKAAKSCADLENAVVLYSKRSMPIEKMLKYPSPIKTCNNPTSKRTPTKKCSSRVLTSSENLEILEEKQRKKAAELKKKEEKQIKRAEQVKKKEEKLLQKKHIGKGTYMS